MRSPLDEKKSRGKIMKNMKTVLQVYKCIKIKY